MVLITGASAGLGVGTRPRACRPAEGRCPRPDGPPRRPARRAGERTRTNGTAHRNLDGCRRPRRSGDPRAPGRRNPVSLRRPRRPDQQRRPGPADLVCRRPSRSARDPDRAQPDRTLLLTRLCIPRSFPAKGSSSTSARPSRASPTRPWGPTARPRPPWRTGMMHCGASWRQAA